jgi:hypothetical protein
MIILDQFWRDICAEVDAGIERWNARAKEKGRPDKFRVEYHSPKMGACLLVTIHDDGDGEFYSIDRRAVYRDENGYLRPVTLIKKGRDVTGFKTKPAPKSWVKLSLGDKPAAEIVKKLKLLDFMIILGARVTEVTTIRPD